MNPALLLCNKMAQNIRPLKPLKTIGRISPIRPCQKVYLRKQNNPEKPTTESGAVSEHGPTNEMVRRFIHPRSVGGDRTTPVLDRGKTKLLGISKRGNVYLREVLIHGARAAVLRIKRDRAPIGAWLDALDARVPKNVVVVAMANKLARIS